MFVEVGEEIEARRREARQKEVLERVLSSINCGVLSFTFEEGEQKITLVNLAAWQLLGFEREDQCLHKSLNDDRNECEFRAADGKGGYRRLHALQQCLRSADGSHLLQITLTDITLQYQIIEQRRTWHE